MARLQYLNEPEDIQWLLDTVLKGYEVEPFKSFLIEGNEDCPISITLYSEADPRYSDSFTVYRLEDGKYFLSRREMR